MKMIFPFAIALTVVSTSCNNGYNPEVIEAIHQSLSQSNELTNHRSSTVLRSLEAKMHEPGQQAKAAIWLPKALAVKELTTAVTQYIDSLKQQLTTYRLEDKTAVNQLFEKEGHRLFSKLLAYRQALPRVVDTREFSENPRWQEVLETDMKNFRRMISTYFEMGPDTAIVDNDTLVATYLNNNTPLLAQAVMTRLKNDLSLAELMMIDYYNNQIGDCCFFWYDRFQIISLLNCYQVKAGQSLEINAGVGDFSINKARPVVKIDNHELTSTPEGTFVYTFKATGKPGIYCIPVSMQYNKPDGAKAVFNQQLEYTITD